MLVKSYRNNLI